MSKRYHYRTCCVNSTAELINALTDSAVEVTYRTFRKHCEGLDGWADRMGYVKDPQHGGLHLSGDWSVSFHKGTYAGVPCYFIDHSRIEYIWTLDGR